LLLLQQLLLPRDIQLVSPDTVRQLLQVQYVWVGCLERLHSLQDDKVVVKTAAHPLQQQQLC
jgi:hypothetical protein